MTDGVSKLPNELSAQIFNFFDVFELAKLERVSKSWQSMIQGNSTLWKDDPFDGSALDLCAVQHEEKYKAMLKRSEGKLDRIFLPIWVSFNTQEKLVSLLKPLANSDVKDLWIVIRKDKTCPGRHKHNEIKTSKRQLFEAVKAVLEVVVQCDKLKSLRLVTTEGVFVNMGKFGDSKKWPFSASRLNKLALHNIRYDSLFPCKEVYQVISQTEDIEISFADLASWELKKKDVWSFISTAEATLKKCRAHYALDKPDTNTFMPTTFEFPQLEELYLCIFDKGAMQSGLPEIMRHNLNCPNLKVLYTLSVPSRMIEQLLCKSIEELCITQLPQLTQDRTRLLEEIEKCMKVKKMVIYESLDASDINELRIRLRRAPLEEITMNTSDRETMLEVKQMVKDRLSIGPFTRIQKVSILANGEDEVKKEIAWFGKHVPNLKLNSIYQRITYQDMQFHQKGLCFFELVETLRVPDFDSLAGEEFFDNLPARLEDLASDFFRLQDDSD